MSRAREWLKVHGYKYDMAMGGELEDAMEAYAAAENAEITKQLYGKVEAAVASATTEMRLRRAAESREAAQIDRAWLEGLKCGWNMGVSGDQAAFEQAQKCRMAALAPESKP